MSINYSQQEWDQLVAKFPSGTQMTGTVRDQQHYGVWVTLDKLPKVPALLEIIHFQIRETDPKHRITFPEDYPAVGTKIVSRIMVWAEKPDQVRLTQLSYEEKMMLEIPSNFEWLKPWEPYSDEGNFVLNEFHIEICENHTLFGMNVRVVGRRSDCDDVLFITDDLQKPIVVVHLTWTGKVETDPTWPDTRIFKGWQDLIDRCLIEDHRKYLLDE
ncbi:hypothetical protein [Rubinisphaera italica]|uniref:Uncharacterized protein n=1 Tax=Rubinisphaera italica TaxID=2527969 RepID=A0A5C5XFQ8_9PLAN|nr:hypothetical protein [Rubinisphaera italica]TWT61261.1 hypothetical protein Pan54_19970 [Rubinisphaera italica]